MIKAKNISGLIEMVSIAKQEKLEYKILYSYQKRKCTNNKSENYQLIMYTNLFSVCFEKTFEPHECDGIKDFIIQEKCIEVTGLKISGNWIEIG